MWVQRICRRRRFFKCFAVFVALFMLWMFVSYLFTFKDEDFPEDVVYDIFIDETRDDHPHMPLDQEILEEVARKKAEKRYGSAKGVDPADPIIMWWTEFTREPGATRTCGDKRCFFTNNRAFYGHRNMRAFLFYGTDFNARDLPLPKQKYHEWALFHEESPKNNYLLCHGDALALFNYTSTFRRESDFPITTQALMSLKWLQTDRYTKTVGQKNKYQSDDGLAPVVFVQSDCDPPSDRDSYMKMLMKHIKVDSYGACLKNKDLPSSISKPIEGMFHKEFYEIISRYKFAVAIENSVCPDYITEKFWRPLMVGTIPIVFGSPSVKDFFPSNNSAISIRDFNSVEDLAKKLLQIDGKDMEYDKMRIWKDTGVTNHDLLKQVNERVWTPDDPDSWSWGTVNFVESFECNVCKKVHERLVAESQGKPHPDRWADRKHYGCPKPLKFDQRGKYSVERDSSDYWLRSWRGEREVARTLRECVSRKLPYCGDYIVGRRGGNNKAHGDF